MKISLNRANKLRAHLEGLQPVFQPSIALSTDLSPEAALEAHKKGVLFVVDQLKTVEESIHTIKVLRDMVHEANEKYGITPIISEIAHLERMKRTIEAAVKQTGYGVASGAQLEDFVRAVEHRSKLEAADITKAPAPQRVNVDVSAEVKDKVAKGVIALKLQIQELSEKRNSLNHSNYIELPEGTVGFLKGLSLV